MAGRSAVAAVRAVAVEGDPGLTAAAAVFTATGRTPGRDRRGSSQRFSGSPVFGRKTQMHCYRFFISTETAGFKKKLLCLFWQLEHFRNNYAGFAAKKLSMKSMPVDAFLSFCSKKGT